MKIKMIIQDNNFFPETDSVSSLFIDI